MNIGILTFHRPINYGAYLQAYSLSEEIKKLIPSTRVEIVDYVASKENRKIYTGILRALKYHGVSACVKEIKKIRVFRNSLKILPLSDKKFICSSNDALFQYIDRQYDYLIIGSDAVFNWNQNVFPTAYIPDYDFTHCKVLTYAASVHGMKYLDADPHKIRACKSAFEKMAFVGVRDENTERFVKYCSPNVRPYHCCDPTCFLSVQDCEEKCDSERIIRKYGAFPRPYLVIMTQNDIISKYIYETFSSQYEIITLFKKNRYSDRFLYDLTPFEWVYIIGRSKCIITEYFHGTYLGLLQDVPAIVIDESHYENEYEGKLKDLMTRRFELPELYYKSSDINEKNIATEIKGTLLDAIEGKYKDRISEGIKREREARIPFEEKLFKLVAEQREM